MQEMAQEHRAKLVEAVAETDEALVRNTWAKNLQKLKFAKVARDNCRYDCASAVWLCLQNKGVQLMLDAVVDLPAPIDVPPIQGTLPSGEVVCVTPR